MHTVRATAASVADITQLPDLLHGQERELFGEQAYWKEDDRNCGADPRKEFAGVSFVRCSCGNLAYSTGIIGAETLCAWCDRLGTLVRHGQLRGCWD